MKQIRFNVFETNSSSTHSITFVNNKELMQFVEGKTFFNTYYDSSKDTNELPEFLTIKQLKNYITKLAEAYNKSIDDKKSNDYIANDSYDLYWLAYDSPVKNEVEDTHYFRNVDGSLNTSDNDYRKIVNIKSFVDTVVKYIGKDGQFISFEKAGFIHISRGNIVYDDDSLVDEAQAEVEDAKKQRKIKKDKSIGILMQYYGG